MSGSNEEELAKRLAALKGALVGTPADYLKEDLQAHVQALRIVLNDDQQKVIDSIRSSTGRFEKAFSELVPFAVQGFPEAVRALSLLLRTFSDSNEQIANLKLAIRGDEQMRGFNAYDLNAIYYRSIRLSESVSILDRVEETMRVLDTVNANLADGKTYQASLLLVKGQTASTSKELMQIRALDQVRADIAERRRTLFKQLIEELISLTYSGVSLSEGNQALRQRTLQRFNEIVRSLQCLEDDESMVRTLAQRVPTVLDRLLLDILQSLRLEDTGGFYGDSFMRPGRLSLVSKGPTGTLDRLRSILPSAQAPQRSQKLAMEVTEKVALMFANAQQGYARLLSKLSRRAVREMSVASVWNIMQDKLVKLTEVLTDTIVLSSRDVARKQMTTGGEKVFFNSNGSRVEFVFLEGVVDKNGGSPTETVLEVVRGMPDLVLSKYNIPVLRPLLIKEAENCGRLAPGSTNTLAIFAEEAMLNDLMAKLEKDLEEYLSCVAGNVTKLINVEAVLEDENAQLPPLPAALGVEAILEEVVVLASNTGSSLKRFSDAIAEFVRSFHVRCWIALNAAKSWTVAGRLFDDETFVRGMQSRMSNSSRKAGASGHQPHASRTPTRKPKLDGGSTEGAAEVQAVCSFLEGLEPQQRTTLSTAEIQAVVRFIAALDRIANKLENPDTYGLIPEEDMEEEEADDGLFEGGEARKLRVLRTVARKLLEPLAGDAGGLREVAGRGVMLLRVDMHARAYLNIAPFRRLLDAAVLPDTAESAKHGMELGKLLVGFERCVKFNLDVSRRALIFGNRDAVVRKLVEIAAESSTAASHKDSRRAFLFGVDRAYENLA